MTQFYLKSNEKKNSLINNDKYDFEFSFWKLVSQLNRDSEENCSIWRKKNNNGFEAWQLSYL